MSSLMGELAPQRVIYNNGRRASWSLRRLTLYLVESKPVFLSAQINEDQAVQFESAILI